MYDVAVIGLGTWGASTLWRLSELGLSTVGIEQYEEANQYGSSHGHTRLFRLACMEHETLGSVAQRSLALWKDLEKHASGPLLHQEGVLTVGSPESDYVHRALQTAVAQGIEYEVLDHVEVKSRYPAFGDVGKHEIGLLDVQGGAIAAEASTVASLRRAEKLGSTVIHNAGIASLIDDSNSIGLRLTTGEEIKAKKIVVAIGPWLSKISGLKGFHALQTPMNWFAPRNPEEGNFDIQSLPGFIRRFRDFSVWGHGDLDGHGVKIGFSSNAGASQRVDPRTMVRDVEPERDWKRLSREARRAFPDLRAEPIATRPCLVTETPDNQFIIGALRGDPRVIVAGGCAGHGFKHSSAIGEYVAELAGESATTLDPGIWSLDRFPGLSERIQENLFSSGL